MRRQYNELMELDTVVLRYEAGTLTVTGDSQVMSQLPSLQFDPRTGQYRGKAMDYRSIVEQLRAKEISYQDDARQWNATPWQILCERVAYPHQTEAVAAWCAAGRRGVVVLPTGTGKTYAAILAIAATARPTLVVTPTIDLLNQWHGQLVEHFGEPVGMLGGGSHDVQPLTVATYDSAYLHVEQWGDRFGLLIFDECHHLPGPSVQLAAVGSLAPFRLGLTATPERADGGDYLYPDLIGPIIYRREIKELRGEFLAEYDVQRIYVELSPADQERYTACRDHFRQFLAQCGISLGSPNGLKRFLAESVRSESGAEAYRAFREQRQLARAAPAKLDTVAMLFDRHRGERTIVFSADNATAYKIARRFLIPVITHQTKAKERRQILADFHAGHYHALATSQVLNEGVDVPAASVGIILSGTASVREHVQRLGRLLRKFADKRALLYEVVTQGTAEEHASDRRRQHHAYR